MIEGQESNTHFPPLSYGMIGGGPGSFIGDVHRKAIAIDGHAVLKSGCFSADFNKTLATGRELDLDQNRLYPTFVDMIKAESKRRDKLDFIVIATPNNTHFLMAQAALRSGIHVVCDKPLTTDSRDAQKLAETAEEKNLLFCVTYAYTGYPIVKHIRDIIADGTLGKLRFINAEYPQEWLATLLEKTGQKQSLWRSDPKQAGLSNCVGDIGSHIENMVSYTTGLKINSLCARLETFVEGRELDDNASILVNYHGGARGLYWSSQIAVGHDNGFRVRIYGSKASVTWCQENPNTCRIAYLDKPAEIFSRGRDKLSPMAQEFSRIPAGHPEGYFEAFANIYSAFISALGKTKAGEPLLDRDKDYPGIYEGIRGVRFIEKCVESSKKGAVWVDF